MKSENHSFYRKMTYLALPCVAQSFVSNSFSLINTFMITGLGDAAVAALAGAGQITFVLGMITSAIYGISAFTTQFYGRGDRRGVSYSLGLMLLSSVSVTSLAVLLVLPLRTGIMRLFTGDALAVRLGGQYLSVMAFSYLINAVKDSYANALLAVGEVKPNLFAGIVQMAANTALNFLLIGGRFGFPALGVRGAALATLLSSFLALAFTLCYVYFSRCFDANPRALFGFSRGFAESVYRVTLPLVFHEGLWSAGNMLYAVAFGHIGIAALAAYQLMRSFDDYFRIGISGFATACKVMVGTQLSGKEPEKAVEYARRFTRISLVSAAAVGTAVLLGNPFLVRIFSSLNEQTLSFLSVALYVEGLMIPVYFLNNVWIVGIFRAGGDNRYTAKLIFLTTWGIALPLVFAGACWLRLPFGLVCCCYACEEISKAAIGYFRYRSNRWTNNLVKDLSPETEEGI